jgi:putative AlgH/UPF0301 family transcriptional regulator
MPVCKLFCFTILAAIAAFVAAEGLNVRIKGLAVPNSHPHDPVLGPDAPLWYMRHPANLLIRQTVLLPIQSKSAKDLGAGKLLVASRGLTDPNFARTVILLVHYDAEGVVGLMVNRRTGVPLSRVLERLKAAKDRSDPVYLGGPVETPMVFALFQSPGEIEGAEHIFGGVYLISTKTLFEQTISKQPEPGAFHVYLGYAGWTMSQLRKEVELGAWFIFQGDAKTVFDSQPDSLWPRMIEKTELQLAHKPFCKVDQPCTLDSGSIPP